MWKKTRGTLLTLVLVAFVLLLAGCGAAATPTPTPTPRPTPTATPIPTPTATPTPLPPGAPTPTPTPRPTPTPVVIEKVVVVTATPTPVPARKLKTTLTVVDATVPNGVDNATATGCCWRHVTNGLYRGLIKSDEKFLPVVDIAASYQASPDAKTWTFKLKPGIKFQDGTPVDAEAVKFNFLRLQDPATLATRRASYLPIKSMDTPDPLTIVFNLSTPDPDFVYLMTDRPSVLLPSPAAVKKYGADYLRNGVGAGPMKLVKFSGDEIVLERWEGYYGEASKFDRLVHKVVPEAATRFAMLLRGETDIALGLSPDDVKRLVGNPDINVVKTALLTQTYGEMRFTPGTPLMDKRVRQAINYAVDKQAIIDGAYGGLGKCVSSPAPPGLQFTVDFGCWPYDPNKARDLLKEAGYPNGFELDWGYLPRWAGFDEMVQIVQANLAAVGIKMNIIKARTMAEQIEHGSKDPASLKRATVTEPIRLSSYVYYHLYRMFHSSSSTLAGAPQRSDYVNAEVDKLISAAGAEVDPAKRAPLFAQAQKLIWEDAPFVWLYGLETATGVRKTVEGFWMNQMQEPVLDKVVVYEK